MGATRKLQGEIDRVLKKVQEGVEVFDSIWNKVYDTENVNQKEKFEADLKKEIKKLQRYRDQIKTWIQSSEIKDKKALIDARKLIEREMERFKVCEKETKTKAFSKEGLGQQPKTDPREKAKGESRDWLNNMVGELESQIDSFEAEMEGLQVRKGKQRPPRLGHLEDSIQRHKAHITKLEMLLRLLDNDELSPEEVNDVKDLIEDYVERNQDDFDEFENVDDLYQGLPLEKMDALESLEAVPVVPQSVLVKEKAAVAAAAGISVALPVKPQPTIAHAPPPAPAPATPLPATSAAGHSPPATSADVSDSSEFSAEGVGMPAGVSSAVASSSTSKGGSSFGATRNSNSLGVAVPVRGGAAASATADRGGPLSGRTTGSTPSLSPSPSLRAKEDEASPVGSPVATRGRAGPGGVASGLGVAAMSPGVTPRNNSSASTQLSHSQSQGSAHASAAHSSHTQQQQQQQHMVVEQSKRQGAGLGLGAPPSPADRSGLGVDSGGSAGPGISTSGSLGQGSAAAGLIQHSGMGMGMSQEDGDPPPAMLQHSPAHSQRPYAPTLPTTSSSKPGEGLADSNSAPATPPPEAMPSTMGVGGGGLNLGLNNETAANILGAQQRLFNSVGAQWRPGMSSSAVFHNNPSSSSSQQLQPDGFQGGGRTEIPPDQKQRYISRFQQVQQQGVSAAVLTTSASTPSSSSSAPHIHHQQQQQGGPSSLGSMGGVSHLPPHLLAGGGQQLQQQQQQGLLQPPRPMGDLAEGQGPSRHQFGGDDAKLQQSLSTTSNVGIIKPPEVGTNQQAPIGAQLDSEHAESSGTTTSSMGAIVAPGGSFSQGVLFEEDLKNSDTFSVGQQMSGPGSLAELGHLSSNVGFAEGSSLASLSAAASGQSSAGGGPPHLRPMMVRKTGFELASVVDNLGHARPPSGGGAPGEPHANLSLLESAYRNMPQPSDSERPRPYIPRNPAATPSSYPQSPHPSVDNPATWEKLDTDVLFFAFYYQQGSYEQYLAARELKRQSWRYHKKYNTWFQRHEEPKLTTDEYEQGTYVYFDFHIVHDNYQTGWCQRIKTEFTFEYSYLEDELVM
eukprot:jgi/Mesen1/2507/ME000016S01858